MHCVVPVKITARPAVSFLPFVVLAACLCTVVGCGSGADNDVPAAPPASLHGVWLGTGTFQARSAGVDVAAQLELLPDGSYRYLILKPAVLAMAGVETGTWTRDGAALTLTPGKVSTTPGSDAPGSDAPGSAASPSEDSQADGASDHAPTSTSSSGTGGGGGAGSVFQKLRETSAPRPPRTLTIADDLSALRFDDGKLMITYTYNGPATQTLRETGDAATP